MKTFAYSLALTAILSLFGTNSARAQSVGSLGDWLYDYELYVAEWETNWYTVVTWDDGTVTEYGSHSQRGAQDWAVWLYLHIVEVKDIEIISREELGDWEYVDTYGTSSQANAAAAEWAYFGYETDIRPIQVNTITETTYNRNLLQSRTLYSTMPIK